jgi:hypothetical protein
MLSYFTEVPSRFRKSQRIAVLLAAAMLAGCDGFASQRLQEPEKRASDTKSAEVLAQAVPPAWYKGELPILRFQEDTARERGWILTRMGVLVFDFKTRQTIGHVSLPDWHWAGEQFSCAPDLALGPKGEALISSNVVPTLWRIDPATLAVSKHELAIDADTDKDVGFTGLAYSAEQGVFFAVSDFGALWRIDPLFTRAQKIALSDPLPKACGVAIRTTMSPFLGLCVHGQQRGWSVNLAPDRRSGHVIAQPCTEGRISIGSRAASARSK